MSSSLVLGVDIGGSHITTALIDCRKKSILEGSVLRQKIDAGETAEKILQDWSATIRNTMALTAMPVRKIGIAMPGPFDYEQGISYMQNQNKFDSLYGLNIRNMLAAALEQEPDFFHFSNDAACFLQGELFAASEPLPDKVAGFTFGTGFGSAVSDLGIATDANLWCAPFKDTIAENYLSTRWFVEKYEQETGRLLPDVLALTQCEGEERLVQSLFSIFGKNLADFITEYEPQYHWETVILGGNISQSYSLFATALEKRLATNKMQVSIRLSQLGESAALVGAAGYIAQLKMV